MAARVGIARIKMTAMRISMNVFYQFGEHSIDAGPECLGLASGRHAIARAGGYRWWKCPCARGGEDFGQWEGDAGGIMWTET